MNLSSRLWSAVRRSGRPPLVALALLALASLAACSDDVATSDAVADSEVAGDQVDETTAAPEVLDTAAEDDPIAVDDVEREASPPDTEMDSGSLADTAADSGTPADTSEDVAVADDAPNEAEAGPDQRARAIVLAGDSWSTGLVQPTRQALDARGFEDVELRWEFTANAGSQARGWVDNEHPPAFGGGRDTTRPRMFDALEAALDAEPPADVLVVVIGGNDYNRECDAGWGELPGFVQGGILDGIGADIGTMIDRALDGRPDLEVVFVGYDYLHYEFLVAFGLRLDGLDTRSYNEGLVEIGRRQRAVADESPQVFYTHNYGILQHTYGDTIHPPFSIPNPLTGLPEYPPGFAPAPGGPPTFEPFPGGLIDYPAPLDYMPDGIHPSPEGFRTIIDNVLHQRLARTLEGSG